VLLSNAEQSLVCHTSHASSNILYKHYVIIRHDGVIMIMNRMWYTMIYVYITTIFRDTKSNFWV